MKKLLTICLFMATVYLVKAQDDKVPNKSAEKTFLWTYQLPDHVSYGPMDALVAGTYTISRERWAGKIRANIQYKITSMSFSNKYGDYRFKYQGKIYKAAEMAATDGLGSTGWNEIKITGIDIRIRAIGLKNEREFFIDKNFSSAVDLGEMGENQDPNSVSLNLVGSYAKNIYGDNEITLTSRIKALLKLVDNRAAYKQYIDKADAAFRSKKWSEAKTAYANAGELFPKESYPPAQIAKIESLLKEAAEKATAAANVKPATPHQAGNMPVNQEGVAGKGKINTNMMNGTAPQNRSSSGATSGTNSGSGQLSEKVKLNGQNVQVFQQGGKYYMVNADGSQHETTLQAYNSVQQASNKKIANINNEAQAAATSRTNDEAAQQANRVAHEQQQAKALQQAQRNAFVGQQLFSSFYAAQAATASKARMDENSKLSGNYESVAQLNEEFNYKYNAISADVQEWTNAKNESLNAATSILTSSRNSTTQTVGLAAGLIGGLINEGNAEKEERERKAALKRQRDAELAAIEAKRKAALVALRRKLLSQYPEGGIPLSAHHITVPEVYFFAYHFDSTNIENNQPAIVVTEVFPLAKYNDDTWPYKNSILKELKQKMDKTDNVTLMGYYTTQKLADDMRNALVTLAPKANFTVTQIAYKGKPKTNEDHSDFWGDGQKKTVENQEDKTEDFWGNPVKKLEKKTIDKPVKQGNKGIKHKR